MGALAGGDMFRGDRLKILRKTKNITQEQLGEMVGLTKSAICFHERGKRNPSIENIIDFIHIFAVSADYLLGTDILIKTVSDEEINSATAITKEEIIFLEEIKKNPRVYDTLFEDPKRGANLIKKKIG